MIVTPNPGTVADLVYRNRNPRPIWLLAIMTTAGGLFLTTYNHFGPGAVACLAFAFALKFSIERWKQC